VNELLWVGKDRVRNSVTNPNVNILGSLHKKCNSCSANYLV
jgi:hypothetical protein